MCCISSTAPTAYKVSLGDHVLSQPNDYKVTVTPAEIILHENHNTWTSENDIALIRVRLT